MVASAEGEAGADGNGKGGLEPTTTAVTANLAAAFSLAGRRVAVAPLGAVARETVHEALPGRADLVLIDGPPVLGIGDASELAPRVDGLLFVAVAGCTRRRALGQARRELDALGTNVIGCVLTNVQAGRSRPGW
jgi:Mrp family chromosome partitioning ATPase